jgi:N-acetylneuraminic acid mutarotase
MQSPRAFDAQVRMDNGKVLAAGGVDSSGNLLKSAEVYSPGSGSWTVTGSMAAARQLFAAVVLKNGKVLVSGGLGASSTVLAGAELYDPASGLWSSAGSLSVARFGHSATLLNSGEVLVAGGCTASDCSTDTAVSELYDPTENSWSTTGRLNTARHDHSAVRLNTGKVLVVGGSTGSSTVSCELYDPLKGTWSNAASTRFARYLSAATLLRDGKVLVTGGHLGRAALASAELYDPLANTWTLTGNMSNGRFAHTATLLSDRTVLVTGGATPQGCGRQICFVASATAEIYDEATGKFTATARMSQARMYHTATLLWTGRVLVAGGTAQNTVSSSVSELYIPLR